MFYKFDPKSSFQFFLQSLRLDQTLLIQDLVIHFVVLGSSNHKELVHADWMRNFSYLPRAIFCFLSLANTSEDFIDFAGVFSLQLLNSFKDVLASAVLNIF